MITHSIPFTF